MHEGTHIGCMTFDPSDKRPKQQVTRATWWSTTRLQTELYASNYRAIPSITLAIKLCGIIYMYSELVMNFESNNVCCDPMGLFSDLVVIASSVKKPILAAWFVDSLSKCVT